MHTYMYGYNIHISMHIQMRKYDNMYVHIHDMKRITLAFVLPYIYDNVTTSVLDVLCAYLLKYIPGHVYLHT